MSEGPFFLTLYTRSVCYFQGILDWVMDTTKRDNKEVQEKLMALQKEKDQVKLSL